MSTSGPPPGFDSAISLDSRDDLGHIERELNEQGVSYQLFELEGSQHIAFMRKNKDIVRLVLNQASYLGPLNHTGICFDSALEAEQKSDVFRKADIPTVIRELKGKPCVYWPIEYRDQVAEVDPLLRAIRQARVEASDDT